MIIVTGASGQLASQTLAACMPEGFRPRVAAAALARA